MTSYVIRRLLEMIPTLLLVSFCVFAMTLALPGDPTTAILGEDATLAQREALRDELGLNRSIPVQYFSWLGGLVSGNFGVSLRTGEPVANMLALSVPVTLQLTLFSILIAIAIGIPAGVLAAVNKGSLIDLFVGAVAMTSMAIPYFWAGMLLIMVFAVNLSWLPPSGFQPLFEDPLASIRSMILPALSIGTAMAALIMRQTRAALIETLSQDFIRTAWAKGARRNRVLYRHALRNSLIPVTTVVGLQIGTLVGGAVVTETVFSMPGLGRMIINGIFWRDFAVVQGGIMTIVLFVLLINLLTDLAYVLLDPRVRLT